MNVLKTNVLASGFWRLKAPRGHLGALWVSDVRAGKVFRIDLDGKVTIVADVPGRPFGLGFLPDGGLLIASMTQRLILKFGPETSAVFADMADVAVTGPFQLVYLVYNTLYNLPNADRQADCFRNVARVLEPDGAFVLECFVLDPSQYDRGQRVEALSVEEDSVVLQVSRHDAAAQRLFKQHLVFDAGGFRGFPVALRYCWPSELDLMARLAGLELAERYADWDRSPYGSDSESHISVYRPARSDRAV